MTTTNEKHPTHAFVHSCRHECVVAVEVDLGQDHMLDVADFIRKGGHITHRPLREAQVLAVHLTSCQLCWPLAIRGEHPPTPTPTPTP